MKTPSKRIATAFGATTAIAALLLSGCGTASTAGTTGATGGAVTSGSSASSSSTASNQVVNITFWNGHPSGALKTQMHAEVAQFNKTHPSIHVTYTDKYSEVQPITAAMVAGDAPNVIMPHLDEAQQFVKDGYLVNLTPYIQGSDGYSQKQLSQDFYPSVWSGRAIEPGQQYIIPYEENGHMVIFYNADLLTKAGITAPPATWNAVEADAAKIRALGSNYQGIAWTPSIIQYFIMVRDDGGTLWANANETKFALDNSGAVKALTMLRAMVANKSMILTQNYGYQLDFGTGNVGMLIESSAGWTYDYKSAGGKFTMKAAPAPSGDSGKAFNYVDGDSLAVMKTGTAAQQQAAWTFVMWLASPQTNAAWDQAANYLPTGPTAASDLTSFYKANPNYAAAFSNPTDWMADPAANATQYYAAESAMNSDFMKGLLGQESPSVAVANMNTIGNEYLSGQKK